MFQRATARKLPHVHGAHKLRYSRANDRAQVLEPGPAGVPASAGGGG